MELGSILVAVVILLISAVLHEVAHGYAANFLGDPTARLAGRLTLNPVRHIDPFGSVILPALMILLRSPILFGYAKPVPYNPYNLRGRYAEAFVAAAGALTNFGLAIALGLSIRFFGEAFPPAFIEVLGFAVYINLMLGVFNLIPIPPLDGAKVLGGILPLGLSLKYRQFESRMAALGPFTGFALVILLFYLFGPIFSAGLGSIFSGLTGTSLLQF
jgi:Zn-dependent protease